MPIPRGSASEPAPAVPGAPGAARALGTVGAPTSTSEPGTVSELRAPDRGVPATSRMPTNQRRLNNNRVSHFTGSGSNVRIGGTYTRA